jgi:hypothetical protein
MRCFKYAEFSQELSSFSLLIVSSYLTENIYSLKFDALSADLRESLVGEKRHTTVAGGVGLTILDSCTEYKGVF